MRLLFEPLRGAALIACGVAVWLAGAAYCHGYQELLTGETPGPWSGSLIWSAFAIVPWFALFEWSKQARGVEAARRPTALVALVVAIGILSIALEYLVHFCVGEVTDHLGLLVMRRMPAIGFTVLLIVITRKSSRRALPAVDTESLESLAKSANYVAAADNYVELHLPGRVAMRRITLTEAAEALKRQGFVRIHRRYLVNWTQVVAVELNGRRIVRLECGAELPIGSAYAANAAALATKRA